jgi:hypothetical protein
VPIKTGKTGLTKVPIKTGKTGLTKVPIETGKTGYTSVPGSKGRTGLPKDPTDPSSTMARSVGIPDPNDLESMVDVSKIPGSDLLVRISKN